MRIKHSANQGKVLFATLLIMGIILMTFVVYLTRARSHVMMTMRSQAWNSALMVAENGLEEALSSLSYTNNLTASGWTYGNGAYKMTRNLSNGYYKVSITNVEPRIITSEGFYPAPLQDNQHISRTVQIVATNIPYYYNAFVVRHEVKMNGNNLLVDSFDSGDPNASTGGLYDPAKRLDGGDVSSIKGITDAVNVGNAQIYGKVRIGPGGSVRVGANGSVGSVAWHQGGNSGIQPGWIKDDMTFTFLNFNLPPVGLAPSAGTVDGDSYQYVMGSGNWNVDDITGPVYVNGEANLTVNNSIQLTAAGEAIVIAPGGSLKLFMNGSQAVLSGNGIQNQTGLASNFQYFGTKNNTSLALQGNVDFTGTVYAPEANFSLGGGGSSSVNFVGSAITYRMDMNGHVNVHYDEALKNIPSGRYRIASWKEL